MHKNRLPSPLIKKIHAVYLTAAYNITATAFKFRIARNTLKRYIRLLREIEQNDPHRIGDYHFCLQQLSAIRKQNHRQASLTAILPIVQPTNQPMSTKTLWLAYLKLCPEGYRYSQFAYYHAVRRQVQGYEEVSIFLIGQADGALLRQWRRSQDHRKWEIAVTLLEAARGMPLISIARKIECSVNKVKNLVIKYQTAGIKAFEKKDRQLHPDRLALIAAKKANLIRLLHEPPELHGFNRTSWRLTDLSTAYQRNFGSTVSIAMIATYIRQEGYVFRKARKTLTSPDPEFRAKLAHITGILSNLGEREKFFSVDEYGPFAVKIKGGFSRVKRGETKTYPQHQKSKGFLICTAALELSTNQVTHFYSLKKDTAEMIILIGLLLEKYRGQEKLYFSWDAASWHASKKLLAYLAAINSDDYRRLHGTPLVELAPLPASAQFLNVIESVFSGLAKSVIHNSDYDSVAACKAAIDRYFAERNAHFLAYPKRAGRKIWGKERVVAEFKDDQNCKDPNWR